MENEDNKPIAKNGADKRQSDWNRFMTLYTTLYAFLLPLVVFIALFCELLFRKWVGYILFDLLCFIPFSAIYLLSVCISLVLIPAILIGIKMHDNAVHEKGNNRRFAKSRGKHQESKFSLFCKSFRYSFLGEIIYIFLYVVLFGVLIALFFLLPNLLQYCAQAILPHSEPVVSVHDSSGQSGWAGFAIAMMLDGLNRLLFCIFLVVFFYVLIRRLGSYQIRQFRAYRRQKARRKERLTKIRNEQNPPPSDSPEQQEGVDDDKAENEF